jgi:hypothetical protein
MGSAEIVSSPLGRARRTAEIICAQRSAAMVRLDDRLREISLASWDGLSRDGSGAKGACSEAIQRALMSFARSLVDAHKVGEARCLGRGVPPSQRWRAAVNDEAG